MYTLYSIAGSCSTGITVLLEKLGVQYTVIEREDVPNYKDIVPTNSVPALKLEDGSVLTEGAAIALYLLEKHGAHLLPSSAEDKAKFNEWLMFNYATLHPAYSKIFTLAMKIDATDDEKAKILPQLATQLEAFWKIVDNHLSDQDVMFGDSATILDYLIAIYASWNKYFPSLTITVGDNVEKLISRVTVLPEFQAAYTVEKTEYKRVA